jgi:HNH endonuclease
MNNNRFDPEFIRRCQAQEIQEQVNSYIQALNELKMVRNPENFIRSTCGKIFYSQEYKKKKRQSTLKRFNKIREDLKLCSVEEKIEIKKFYFKCPLGYEIDHIVPLSKGGSHRMSNLQYLTKEQNRRKRDNLDWAINEDLKTNFSLLPLRKSKYIKSFEEYSKRYKARIIYKNKIEKCEEYVLLRKFNERKICPECLKRFPIFHKICDSCPNEEIKLKNKELDENFKIYRRFKKRLG